MKFHIPLIGLAMVLPGCSTFYTPPQSGPMATLTIVKDGSRPFAAATYVNADDCSGGRLVLSGPQDPATRSYAVIADKPMALTLAVDLPHPRPGLFAYGCNGALVLTPQPGERYQARLLIHPDSCTIKILKTSGAALTPGELQPRKWIRPVWDSGAYCKPR